MLSLFFLYDFILTRPFGTQHICVLSLSLWINYGPSGTTLSQGESTCSLSYVSFFFYTLVKLFICEWVYRNLIFASQFRLFCFLALSYNVQGIIETTILIWTKERVKKESVNDWLYEIGVWGENGPVFGLLLSPWQQVTMWPAWSLSCRVADLIPTPLANTEAA